MTVGQMEEKIQELERQNIELEKIIKDLDKMVNKNLKWWFLFPFFGFIIYNLKLQKRKISSIYHDNTLRVKTEITKNQFQILKLKRDLNKNSESQNN